MFVPAMTDRTKVSVAVAPAPSATVTVIVVRPACPPVGVIVRMRLVPFLTKTRFSFGTKLVLEELRVTLKFPAGVSASLTVKLMAMDEPCLTDWLGMSEIVGGVLTAVSADTKSAVAPNVVTLAKGTPTKKSN